MRILTATSESAVFTDRAKPIIGGPRSNTPRKGTAVRGGVLGGSKECSEEKLEPPLDSSAVGEFLPKAGIAAELWR